MAAVETQSAAETQALARDLPAALKRSGATV